MPNSIQQDRMGPDWPLGFINVAVPGTPVGLMSLVDAAGVNNPATTQSNQGATAPTGVEFPIECNQIQIQGFKPGGAHGTQRNTGNIYVVRTGVGAGTGNRDDQGAIVATIEAGQTYVLAPSATKTLAFSPYRYSIDADNAGDGAFVTLII